MQLHESWLGNAFSALGRCRQDWIAPAAEAAFELGVRKQVGHLRIARGGENGEPVERAREERAIDHVGARAAVPAGPRIASPAI
jgi:hypothetical protein